MTSMKKAKYEIETCRDSLTVSVAETTDTLKEFSNFRVKEGDFSAKNRYLPKGEQVDLRRGFSVPLSEGEAPKYYCKKVIDLHKEFCELLGPKFNYRIRAAHYNTMVKDHFPEEALPFLRSTGFNGWKLINKGKLLSAHTHKGKLWELHRDGLTNLMPVTINTGWSPQEAKEYFGKSLWKTIANSSKTKNHLIFSELPAILHIDSQRAVRGLVEKSYKTRYKFLPHIRANPSKADFFSAVPKGTSTRDAVRVYNKLWDTQGMFNTLGWDGFNAKWSFQRIEREHQKATQAINARRYSPEPFCSEHVMEVDGYKFTRLISPLEVQTEGDVMHHCVGSYADRCNAGQYMVYSVEGKDQRGTLGLSKARPFGHTLSNELYPDGWVFHQLYGYCNRHMPQDMHDAAREVIDEINSDGHRIGWLN